MATTVPFTLQELGMIIEYHLAHGENGKMWAALMCFMFLAGCRISEALEMKFGQIADSNLKLYPIIQPAKKKSEKRKPLQTVEVGLDSMVGRSIERWILKNGKIDREKVGVIKVQIYEPDKLHKKNVVRTVDLDVESISAKIIEEWLKEARRRFMRFSQDDYVFSVRMNGRPVWPSSVYKAFGRGCKKLKLDYVCRGSHSVRKTAGLSRFESAREITGSDFRAIQMVQLWFGHSSAKTTEKYLPLPDQQREALAMRHSARLKIGNSISKHST